MMPGRMSKEGVVLGGLVLPVVAGLLFSRSALWGTFVYDDHQCIVDNPHVATGYLADVLKPPFWLADFWGNPVKSASSHKSWRPLTTLSFLLNKVALGGLNPSAFHVVNVCLHAIITGLFWLCAVRIFSGSGEGENKRQKESGRDSAGPRESKDEAHTRGWSLLPSSRAGQAALCATAIWTVHPMHTEAVSNSKICGCRRPFSQDRFLLLNINLTQVV